VIADAFWVYVYYSFLFVCCGYAVWKGAHSEYVGAAIMVIGSLSSLAVGSFLGTPWINIEVEIFAIDILALVALSWLSLKSSRFWPIWATAFHLLAVSIHAAMLVAPQIKPWAFATGSVFWAYPMLLALAVGARENKPARKERILRSG